MPYRFWFLGGDEDVRAAYLAASEARNSVVILERTASDNRYAAERARLESRAYRLDHVVCGETKYPVLPMSPLCHSFFVPVEASISR